ncbi:MAG: response regulator [bacterium]
MVQPLRLVLVEDSEADIETVSRAVDQLAVDLELEIIRDGVTARDRFFSGCEQSPTERDPDLIILDLNLPGVDGRTFLRELNDSRVLSDVPIVVLTTSKKQEDVTRAYRNGASAYIIKPGNINEYIERIQSLCEYWLQTNFRDS